MADPADTPSRILDGALRALARHGRHKLSMSDICHEAHISRGTLYRYFKSKEEVLDAIGKHVQQSFRRALEEAIVENPAVEDRLRLVLEVLVHYADTHEEAALVFQAEPEFALKFLEREFSTYVVIVRRALDEVLHEAEVVRDGVLTKSQIAELFLRIALSTHFVPSPGAAQIPKRVADLWAALNRSSKPAARLRQAARAPR